MTTSFQGLGIFCFYTNGLFQGHLIDKENNKSPYSLAGKHLPNHVDPLHNDCMEADDFYQVLIQPHVAEPVDNISLILRRPKNNDAGGLSTHENEIDINDGYQFLFETNQFMTGQKALSLTNKYFPSSTSENQDVIVCIGDIKFNHSD